MFPEPWQVYVVSGLAVVLIGIAKAGFGGGVGVAAVPVMSLVMLPSDAAAILLPLLCLCDLFSIAYYRKVCDWRNLMLLLPGALLGILLGYFCFNALIERKDVLRLGIGIITIVFVLFQWYRERILQHITRFNPDWRHGLGFGTAAGFTSTLAHAAGPVAVIFLLPQRLNRRLFVGTTVWFFTLVNAIKLVPYYFLDVLNFSNMRTSLVLAPLVPIGVYLGIYLDKTISEKLFNRLVYALTFLTGLELVGVFKLLVHLAG